MTLSSLLESLEGCSPEIRHQAHSRSGDSSGRQKLDEGYQADLEAWEKLSTRKVESDRMVEKWWNIVEKAAGDQRVKILTTRNLMNVSTTELGAYRIWDYIAFKLKMPGVRKISGSTHRVNISPPGWSETFVDGTQGVGRLKKPDPNDYPD